MAPVDPVRRVAFDVLAAVRTTDAYVNLLLPRLLSERGIEGRDARFATELVHGTIRMQGSYDAVIARVTRRNTAAVDPPVLDVLRLGVHQLLSLRVPAHAAVDTSVSLVRTQVGHRPAGFVNACLRKVGTRSFAAWMEQVAPTDRLGRLAVVHSHPRWVVAELERAAGSEVAEALAADNVAPEVTLVARPGLTDPSSLPGRPGRWSPYAVVPSGLDPGDLTQVRDGSAAVQDEGSQLVAIAAAAAEVEGGDERWLDLCSGPGGKTALLAALGADRGVAVVASELHAHRAELVRQTVRRLSNVQVVRADGTDPPWRVGSFDRVLLDAPCTGLGALRRRPEVRWRRRPSDLERLVPLQRTLLASALELVRPGGVVTYATCSPVVAETVEVVETVRASEVELLDATRSLPAIPGVSGPYVQLWPHRHGTDAMFIAQLRRR